MNKINLAIKEFLDTDVLNNNEGRYKSWDIIYSDFEKCENIDYLSRSLTIYLASWGMMRGSSELLKKYNYKVHEQSVSIISTSLKDLRNYPKKIEYIEDYVEKVFATADKLGEYYKTKGVSATDTLLSKIILGTSAATPAYDQYFKEFLKWEGIAQSFSKKSLIQIWEWWFRYHSKISNKEYPPMKLVDMTGFILGKKLRMRGKKSANKQGRSARNAF